MRIMKTVSILIVLGLTIGCATSAGRKIMVQGLDTTIREAAEKAKLAGAKSLDVELSVVSGFQAGVSVPILVVNLSGGTNIQNATKLTAKIDDLSKWPPKRIEGVSGGIKAGNQAISSGADYFILDTKTFKLENVPPLSDR